MVDPYQAAAKAAEERAEAERATKAAAAIHRRGKSEVPVTDLAAQLAALDLACLEAGLGSLAQALAQMIGERHGVSLDTVSVLHPSP